MRTSSLILRFATVAAAIAFAAPFASLAQTFAATTAVDPVVVIANPTANKMKAVAPKNAEEALLFGRVREGVYTVDGMVAKVRLNYDLNGVHYLYLFVPGVGTALVSATADPDAISAKARLQDNELAFTVGEHRFTLTGVALATSKGGTPEQLYVKLDRAAWNLNRHPMIGFGNSADVPYQWPGALSAAAAPTPEASQIAPPVPVNLLPSTRTVTPTASLATPVTVRPLSVQ